MPPITGEQMDRVTVRMPEEMKAALDRAVDRGEFPNRSEAVRAAVRNDFGLRKRTTL